MARYNLLAVALIGATLVMGNPSQPTIRTATSTTTPTTTAITLTTPTPTPTTTTYPSIHNSHYGPESVNNPIYLHPTEENQTEIETEKRDTIISPVDGMVHLNNDPILTEAEQKINPADKETLPTTTTDSSTPIDDDSMIHTKTNDPTLTETGPKISPVDGMPHHLPSTTNTPTDTPTNTPNKHLQSQPRSDIMDAFHHIDDILHRGQTPNGQPPPPPSCPDDGLPRDPKTCEIHANFADPNYPDIIVDGKLDEALKQMPKFVPDRPSVNAPPPVTEREKKTGRAGKVEKRELEGEIEGLIEERKIPVWETRMRTRTRTWSCTKPVDLNGNGDGTRRKYSRPTAAATMMRKRRTVQALPTDVV